MRRGRCWMRCDAAEQGNAGVLIIGIGNPLRGDDGAGVAVVMALQGDAAFAGATFVIAQQLMPEHAAMASEAAFLLIVDASVNCAAGEVCCRVLRACDVEGTLFGHHLTPEQLLRLTRAAFDRAPTMVVVSVGAAEFALGVGLSPAVTRGVTEAVHLARAQLAAWLSGGVCHA